MKNLENEINSLEFQRVKKACSLSLWFEYNFSKEEGVSLKEQTRKLHREFGQICSSRSQ